MEQAGINSIQLIENRDTFILYNEDGTIVQIDSSGETIEINSDFPINLSIQESRNNNGKIGYDYEIDFINISASEINTLRRSIYGFIPVMLLMDGTTRSILTPLKYNSANQDNNISASYSTKISNFVATDQQIILFNPEPLQWILENGTWNDDNLWLDSAIWID